MTCSKTKAEGNSSSIRPRLFGVGIVVMSIFWIYPSRDLSLKPNRRRVREASRGSSKSPPALGVVVE